MKTFCIASYKSSLSTTTPLSEYKSAFGAICVLRRETLPVINCRFIYPCLIVSRRKVITGTVHVKALSLTKVQVERFTVYIHITQCHSVVKKCCGNTEGGVKKEYLDFVFCRLYPFSPQPPRQCLGHSCHFSTPN
jgi:hypothetical protein